MKILHHIPFLAWLALIGLGMLLAGAVVGGPSGIDLAGYGALILFGLALAGALQRRL